MSDKFVNDYPDLLMIILLKTIPYWYKTWEISEKVANDYSLILEFVLHC